MLSYVSFALLSLVLLSSAFMVVTTANLVHSVLFLAVTLVTTAGLYLQLESEFLAAVQVLLYAGGVVTLMIFAVMLTKRMSGEPISQVSQGVLKGGILAGGLLLVFIAATLKQGSLDVLPAGAPVATKAVGDAFLTTFMLPFEVLSVLLVATMIGAIALARKEDP